MSESVIYAVLGFALAAAGFWGAWLSRADNTAGAVLLLVLGMTLVALGVILL